MNSDTTKFQPRKRRLLSATVLLAFSALSAGTANAQTQIAKGDFNGDGRDDMMVGIPSEDIGLIEDAGAVSVFHGTASGLYDQPVHQIHQDSPATSRRAAIQGKAEAGDHFGAIIAVGDFDNDGYDDAAIGVPNEDSDSGAVHIQYGSRYGAYGPRNGFFTLALMQYGTIAGRFGAALATGDINGDGYDDLAIGAPDHDAFIDMSGAGGVMVMYGSANGLTKHNTQFIFRHYRGVPGISQENDAFGSALAMNDFDRDGHADLAIGIPGTTVNGEDNAGDVVVLYGGTNGILGGKTRTPLVDLEPEKRDRFGSSLSSGDFDGNGYPDLAVGHPWEDSGVGSGKGEYDSGEVTVFYSDSNGLDFRNRQHLSQRSIDKVEKYDNFGHSLAAADFNGDGFDDLAIGAPFETHERRFRFDYYGAGQVTVLFGRPNGLRATSNSSWHQDSSLVAGKRYRHNLFGYALETGDFNNDRLPDLAVSVPGEDVNLDNGSKQKDAGTIHILYGHSGGLSSLSSLGREVYAEPIRTVGNTAGRVETDDGFGGFPIQPCFHFCSPF